MIAYLQGRLLGASLGNVLIDVNGVGYEVQVSSSTLGSIQSTTADGDELSLFIFTYARPEALVLFGFWTEKEKEVFCRLIAVSGVGPKLAQTILSGLSADDIVDTLIDGDIRRLCSIPGVGKKTAGRIVLELKEKIQDLHTEKVAKPAGSNEDLVGALIGLGYREDLARNVVGEVDSENLDLAEQLRVALRLIANV